MHDFTRILTAIVQGDPQAAEQLLPLVYDQLRKLAAAKLAREQPGHTLQATALVHEAWLRVVDVNRDIPWNSRHHFFAAAAEAMRRVLVDAARRKAAVKHGGEVSRVAFDELLLAAPERPEEVLAVHEALDELAIEDPLIVELVKLHYFAGLPFQDAAEMLNISRATAYRMWTYARAWLRATLLDQASETENESF
jgi:RNA polymerase sigma factor (TIGR02999 family)